MCENIQIRFHTALEKGGYLMIYAKTSTYFGTYLASFCECTFFVIPTVSTIKQTRYQNCEETDLGRDALDINIFST